MAVSAPILVGESGAARLFDMKPAAFRALVEAGHLPRGREIAPGVVRWVVEDLRRVVSGEATRPDQGLEL